MVHLFRRRCVPAVRHAVPLAALVALLCLCSGPAHAAEVFYSVQTGSFIKPELAERQHDLVRKNLSPPDLDQLRIERYREFYSVRVGRFPTRAAAEALLGKVRAFAPEAYIVRIGITEESATRMPGKEPSPEAGKPQEKPPPAQPVEKRPEERKPEKKKDKPVTGKVEQKPAVPTQEESFLKGKVLQTGVIASRVVGLSTEGTVYRVTLTVEETRGIEGKYNLLKGREGETLTFFSEESITPGLSGMRIEARAEYRGDEHGKLFWLRDIRVIE